MVQDFNLHTHTVFSDGKNTAEEMTQEAIRLGMKQLGFSDHSPTVYSASCDMTQETLGEYWKELRRLREKYAGQIEILIGIERDFYAPPEMDFSEFDYVLESVHRLYKGGVYSSIDNSKEGFARLVNDFYGGDVYAMCRDYFKNICEITQRPHGRLLGHFDLVTKFNEVMPMLDPEDKRFLDPALEAMRCAVDAGMIFEVNTGAISRGYRTSPYPSLTLLKALKAMGGSVILSSDCHSSAHILYAFDQAKALCDSVGGADSLLLPRWD